MMIYNNRYAFPQADSIVLKRRANNGAKAFGSFLTVLTCAMMAANSARADFVGFGNFSQFKINNGDGNANPTISIANDRVLLTNPTANSQRRSIFQKTPQPVAGAFTASFTYQASTGGGVPWTGLAFVIQNSPAGFEALGGTWSGLGFSNITNSVAITLELDDGGRSGLYLQGAKGPAGGSLTAPLNFGSGNPIDVEIVYDGVILASLFTDTVTHAAFSADYPVDIPSIIGGNSAYVGFSASTGVDSVGRSQYVSHPSFITVPEPSSVALSGLGALGLLALCLGRPAGRFTAQS